MPVQHRGTCGTGTTSMKTLVIFRPSLILCLFAFCCTASAQQTTEPSDDPISKIEQQIQSLKEAVQELRRPGSATTRPTTKPEATQPATAKIDDPIARIRDEGLNHSQVMATLSYLTDVI